MRIRREEEEAFEIPLIPMIDCMLVIIIFFLVATTLKRKDKELPIDLPTSGVAAERELPDDLLIIGIDKEHHKFLGSQPVTTEMLRDEIKKRASKDDKQRVRIDADISAQYLDIVQVIDLCEFEGLKNIGLHTRETKE